MPRKTNKIPSNKTILIVVEGQTEQIYFSEMNIYERIPGVSITSKESTHSDIEHVISMAINEYSFGVYDSIWCVFDRDTVERDNLKVKITKIIKKAISKGIRIADSMPAFEIWFLAHYQKPQLFYSDQNAVIEELRKYIEGYDKDRRWLERRKLYSLLKEKQEEAIHNCEKFEQARIEYGDKCTSCRVHELILFILNSANNRRQNNN